jgi:hypothetical protein
LENPTAQLNVEDIYGLLALWWEIVSAYSFASLTVPTDKEVAFSGIVEVFRKRTGWKYLAGLWEPFLLNELLWYRSPEAGLDYHVHTSQPTWSWLRVDQGALWCSLKKLHSITILASAKVVDERQVPAVLILSFRLKIEFLEGTFNEEASRQMGYVKHRGKVHRFLYYPDMEYHGATRREWIPFIYYDDDGPRGHDDPKLSWYKFDGLVVAPVPGTAGTYKRIGFATTWIKKDDPTSFCFPPIENDESASHDPSSSVDFGLMSSSARDHFASRYSGPKAADGWKAGFYGHLERSLFRNLVSRNISTVLLL